jgi:hypothetical protein
MANVDTKRRVRRWMQDHRDEHDGPTQLAEDAATIFELYEDDDAATIPEWVFELSATYYDVR